MTIRNLSPATQRRHFGRCPDWLGLEEERAFQVHLASIGMLPGEGASLPCGFWLADNYIFQGRLEEARDNGCCRCATIWSSL